MTCNQQIAPKMCKKKTCFADFYITYKAKRKTGKKLLEMQALQQIFLIQIVICKQLFSKIVQVSQFSRITQMQRPILRFFCWIKLAERVELRFSQSYHIDFRGKAVTPLAIRFRVLLIIIQENNLKHQQNIQNTERQLVKEEAKVKNQQFSGNKSWVSQEKHPFELSQHEKAVVLGRPKKKLLECIILIMSLYTNAFCLFIIFSMQVKEINHSDMALDLQQSFITQKPSFDEISIDLPVLGESVTEAKNTNAPTPKAKGRPKGQKNSQNKQKKPKVILNEQNHRRGHWSLQQNKRYHWFLEIYNKHFICKEMRRLDKIFKTMAAFIGTRQAQQCRSHHQKMEKKYHSFPSILLYLRRFHYGTQDSAMVEQDMRKNQVKQEGTLIHCKELQDLQLFKDTPTISSFQQEAKAQCQPNEPQKQLQFQQNLLDLFGENYEHRFGFHSFLF